MPDLFDNTMEEPGKFASTDWDRNASKRALDDLFVNAGRYRSTESYKNLIEFVARFRAYSPYNAMLVHIQMPGARYVAPARRWVQGYGRLMKSTARPLAILQPMGPIMFVFDVSDTEPGPHPIPLPREVENPFEVRSGTVGGELEKTIENAKCHGIQIDRRRDGSQRAGSISSLNPPLLPPFEFPDEKDKSGNPVVVRIPRCYGMILNENHDRTTQYSTMVHELAHLYCGHLGTLSSAWWPDRQGMSVVSRELEAESVAFLVCRRLEIQTTSDEYLSGYLGGHLEVPPISLDCIMKAAGLIEKMGKRNMKPKHPQI